MIHTVIIDGRSYDLPKKNMKMAGKIDDILRVDSSQGMSLKQRFEKLHIFVKEVLGEDTAKEILGSDNLEDVDLSELTLAVRKIIDGYQKPIADYEMEKSMEKFSAIPTGKFDSMSKVLEMSAKMGNK